MSVDRVASCDVCGVRIVECLDSEDMDVEIAQTGGCPGSIHPQAMDLCAEHLRSEPVSVQQAVEAFRQKRLYMRSGA